MSDNGVWEKQHLRRPGRVGKEVYVEETGKGSIVNARLAEIRKIKFPDLGTVLTIFLDITEDEAAYLIDKFPDSVSKLCRSIRLLIETIDASGEVRD